jgi:hypothetical protein
MASRYFLEYYELFFFMKSHGKGPWIGGQGPRWFTGVIYATHNTRGVKLVIYSQDLIS